MKRVIIFRNGQTNNGKAILIPETLDTLLSIASCKFNCVAKILFTSKGGEIDDIDVIKDDEVLYVSCGESFMSLADLQTVDCSDDSEWVTLNVGGKRFTTTRSTLTKKEPDSMLARMFARDEGAITWSSSRDKKGAFLIDRSPTYFEPILNYLRHGEIIADKNTCLVGVLEEAKFFGLDTMIEQLELMIREDEPISDNVSLSRQDVIRALIVTSSICELRFQGVNLAGADLSKLDLRYINFKHANLQRTNLVGANLSFCYLERADLSHAILDGAHILGVKMLCANLEGASLRNCNFEDPAGSRANMEGVNLKGVNMEGSQMAGVNLRVATLKNANLQNCDLRGAVLAGADLENCDLSGSDLHEANLRGANLKGAAFELMLTPLHMSQTIR